jgi:hypothetical protein
MQLPDAAFFDPDGDGFDGRDFVLFGSIITLVGIALRWLWRRIRPARRWTAQQIEEYLESVVERVLERVDERTAPIQPGANGGESLPDTAKLTAWCADAICVLAGDDVVLPPRPDIPRTVRTRASDAGD